MQQTCQRCGYESPPGARFCRQCGAPLFVENEATQAATRQYGYGQSAPAAEPTQPEPPDYLGHDTARFHRPPVAPTYAIPTPSQSNTGRWIVVALLIFLAIGGLASVGVISFLRSPHAPAAEEEFERRIEEAAERAAEAAARQAEAAARQAEAAARQGVPPPPPPPPPPPGNVKEDTSIDQLKYPNATFTKRVNTLGNEILKMKTSDEIEKVREFYEEKMGDPLVREDEGQKIVFITHGKWNTVVSISPDKSGGEGTIIDVVRTFIPAPKAR